MDDDWREMIRDGLMRAFAENVLQEIKERRLTLEPGERTRLRDGLARDGFYHIIDMARAAGLLDELEA